jgi:hypothetical protein
MSHKTGDVVAIVRYAKVNSAKQDAVELEDVDDKSKFVVRGKELLDTLRSASNFQKTEKVTLTKAAEIVSSSFNTPMTVCFTKQDGTERVMVCRLLSTEPLLGRSHVDDLEITEKHKLRQVDHRTIKWAVINGVKYQVK